VSREDQDELAVISHQRASTAISQGRFTNQITTVSVPQRKGDPITVMEDEGPRADTTIEGLSNLRPVFKKDGTVTAGNASSINDGSAAVVIRHDRK
jgi:acetyl-CoA C-acetyltransferase